MQNHTGLIKRLREKVGRQGYLRAQRDGHAKRKPRPCGLTVHPGIGCDSQCKYCYIQGLGFKFTMVKPYHLLNWRGAYPSISSEQVFQAGKGGNFPSVWKRYRSITPSLH